MFLRAEASSLRVTLDFRSILRHSVMGSTPWPRARSVFIPQIEF